MSSPDIVRAHSIASSEVLVDERAARRALHAQIARLEGELASLFCSAYPRLDVVDRPIGAGAGPRLLSISDLEQVRDRLRERLERDQHTVARRTAAEGEARVLVERMLREPERYPWVRVQNADMGEPGCRSYHVRPRFGLLGMLLDWWRVVVSSGCP